LIPNEDKNVQYPIPSVRFCFMRKSKEASIFYDYPNTNESARKLEDGSKDDVVVSGRSGE